MSIEDGQQPENQTFDDRLAGKVALVTGGSRGIGRATCFALAARGAAVLLHYRTQVEAANEVVAQIRQAGGRAAAFQGDLHDPQLPENLIRWAIEQFGTLHILVNNAAEMTDASLAEMPDTLWEHTLAVNLTAVFRCVRASLPYMQRQRWGRIINLTSQAAYTGSANHAHYAASKSGLAGFSYSLAKEVGAFNITVNLVAPGRIVTDMLADRMIGREEEWLHQTPLRRFGRPEEVAAVIAFLSTEGAGYITGATIHVNGGLVMS